MSTVEIPATLLRKLSKAADILLSNEMNDWVNQQAFSEKTGLKTTEQLRYFREKHPHLVRTQGNKKVDTLDRTVRGPFIYNLKEWFKLFEPLIKERD